MASIEVKTQSDKGRKWSNQGTLANILTQLKGIANDAGVEFIKETSPIMDTNRGVMPVSYTHLTLPTKA